MQHFGVIHSDRPVTRQDLERAVSAVATVGDVQVICPRCRGQELTASWKGAALIVRCVRCPEPVMGIAIAEKP